MKKIKYIITLLLLTFSLTGCVKFNANMEIKKDKSMNFSIIYAVNSSLLNNQPLLEDKDKKELTSQGFTIESYSEGNMTGFTLSKSIRNIDFASSTSDTTFSLSNLLDPKNPNKTKVFKVKKGLFKNTYTANLKFNASDSNLSSNSSNNNSSDTDSDIDNDLWGMNNNTSKQSILPTNTTNDNDSSFDFSSLTSGMDLSFNVTLPYKAISNNATKTSNDNKTLTWDLSSDKKETIQFEFMLYNMTTIYIIIGLGIIIIIGAVLLILKNKKNNNNTPTNESKNISESQINNNSSISNVIQNNTPNPNNLTTSTINVEPINQPTYSTNQPQPQPTITNIPPIENNPPLNQAPITIENITQQPQIQPNPNQIQNENIQIQEVPTIQITEIQTNLPRNDQTQEFNENQINNNSNNN